MAENSELVELGSPIFSTNYMPWRLKGKRAFSVGRPVILGRRCGSRMKRHEPHFKGGGRVLPLRIIFIEYQFSRIDSYCVDLFSHFPAVLTWGKGCPATSLVHWPVSEGWDLLSSSRTRSGEQRHLVVGLFSHVKFFQYPLVDRR